MTSKTLMGGCHLNMQVFLPNAFVERVAQAIHALGHNPVDLEAVGFVFDAALARLFACKPGPKFDELVREGLFALALEQARRATEAEEEEEADVPTLH